MKGPEIAESATGSDLEHGAIRLHTRSVAGRAVEIAVGARNERIRMIVAKAVEQGQVTHGIHLPHRATPARNGRCGVRTAVKGCAVEEAVGALHESPLGKAAIRTAGEAMQRR